MASYVLDTNSCIALINGKPPAVRARFRKALSESAEIFVSSNAAFELWYGVAKSGQVETNSRLLETFFAGPITVLPFDDEDASRAGALRAALESSGRPIGAYDLLIAGQALRRKLTLVTANAREFAHVKDLSWENWATP